MEAVASQVKSYISSIKYILCPYPLSKTNKTKSSLQNQSQKPKSSHSYSVSIICIQSFLISLYLVFCVLFSAGSPVTSSCMFVTYVINIGQIPSTYDREHVVYFILYILSLFVFVQILNFIFLRFFFTNMEREKSLLKVAVKPLHVSHRQQTFKSG